jgi:DNA-binding MarR family transcriptional regulator
MSSTQRSKMTRAEFEILAQFRYSLRQFLRFSELAARSAGLTPQQHQVLLAIKGYPGPDPISVGKLAERLQVRHHSAVELVDRLQTQGLTRRKLTADDRRQVLLELTPRGERVLEKLSATHQEQLRNLAPQLEALLASLRQDTGQPGRS